MIDVLDSGDFYLCEAPRGRLRPVAACPRCVVDVLDSGDFYLCEAPRGRLRPVAACPRCVVDVLDYGSYRSPVVKGTKPARAGND